MIADGNQKKERNQRCKDKDIGNGKENEIKPETREWNKTLRRDGTSLLQC